MFCTSILNKCYLQAIAKFNLMKLNRKVSQFLPILSIPDKSFLRPTLLPVRTFCFSLTNLTKMVDPKRVISYEDMLRLIRQPEKVIIDVRNPDEINSTGRIPSSINIPLSTVHDALSSMSAEDFKKQYHRDKPTECDELIFYCRSGKRSTEALDKALKLGYTKSKTYLGSWDEWSNRQK